MFDSSSMQGDSKDNEQMPYPMRTATEPVKPMVITGTGEEGFREVECVDEETHEVSEERCEERLCMNSDI